MSYDITIAADDKFSEHVSRAELRNFLSTLPGVQPNGEQCFVLSRGDELWMEIDPELVTEEGDTRDDDLGSSTVNCIRLHIPYAELGKQPESDYYPTARAIAEHLGWVAMDEQTGAPLAPATSQASSKPWWRFW